MKGRSGRTWEYLFSNMDSIEELYMFQAILNELMVKQDVWTLLLVY